MKRGRSTGTPTVAQAARIVAAKEGPCMACVVLGEDDRQRCDAEGCDFHHMKSGNIRRGHEFGIALCVWHHRGYPLSGLTSKQMRELFGPSLMDGSRLFHEAFGSDDVLLERQNQLINNSTSRAA